MSTQLGSRTIASPLLPCFETLFRSPIASSSRSRTRSTSTLLGSRQALRPSLSRGYAQPASKPVEDEGPSSQVDGDASASSSRSQDGSTGKSEPSRRRGGLSDEEKAKWAFPSKINPTPYDVLHLPKTASKADIKRHCQSCYVPRLLEQTKLTRYSCTISSFRLPSSHVISSRCQPPFRFNRQLYGTS
jgi:hypothetical protein